MGNPSAKRRRPEEGKGHRRPAKKLRKNFKKQKEYHSSSDESDDDGVKIIKEPEMSGGNSQPLVPRSAVKDVPKTEPVAEIKPATKPLPKSALKPTPVVEPQEEIEDAEEEDEDEELEDVEDDVEVEGLDDLEDDDEVDLEAGADEEMASVADEDSEETDGSSVSSADGEPRKTRKRNDPTAFATSLSKILASKLSTSKRADPVLSRSVDAATASRELNDAKLEAKAKRQINAEKRQAMQKGRVKDVLGLNSTDVSTAEIQEQERRLKKTAQRGVVKLFNAVRAAQVKGEMARSDAKKEGVVGMGQREERVSEMSKKGFLDLIAQGGKKAPVMNIQEA